MSTVVASLLVVSPAGAMAGTERVCNAYFCNSTEGDGDVLLGVTATKIGSNRGSTGFFNVFWPGGSTDGPTNRENEFNVGFHQTRLAKNQLVCVRYFLRLENGSFKELGSAVCTKAPF